MSKNSTVEKEIKVTIPMLPDMELAVSSLASSLAESISLDADKIDEIKMAIIEACLNAFEHSRSKDQMVFVRFLIRPDRFEITVRDNGVGFDPDKVKEPLIEEKFGKDKKRGWGLKIMESLMDDVKIKSDTLGTQIVMIKRRD